MLVSPPAREVLADLAPEFARPLPTRDAAGRTSGTLHVAASEADPYNPVGARTTHAEPLGATLRVEPGEGHVSADDGYGPWPAIETWCRTRSWPS